MTTERKQGPKRGPFSDWENEVLREAVAAIVRECGNQTKAGELLGVGQSAITNYKTGRSGVGGEVAAKIAEHLGYPSLLAFFEAKRSGEAKPTAHERYPNRGAVVSGARVMRIGADTIEQLQRLNLRPGQSDAPTLFWLKQLVRLLEEAEGPQLE